MTLNSYHIVKVLDDGESLTIVLRATDIVWTKREATRTVHLPYHPTRTEDKALAFHAQTYLDRQMQSVYGPVRYPA